jgi:ethanolamine ammonia-lyase small subunit
VTVPPWDELRRVTQARIGLGRAGNGLPTDAELALRAAHAAARDAVREALDVGGLVAGLRRLDLAEPLVVRSRAGDRGTYLRRPDLGRSLAEPLVADGSCDLAIVLADGLSAAALTEHGVPLVASLLPSLQGRVIVPVIATQARVALGDEIGVALGARAVLVLIGERPGLSVPTSLGAYLTWAPRPGRVDAERNCVSNVHPPDGLGYDDAARVLAGLLDEAERLGETGVRVKDRSRPAVGSNAGPVLEG